MATTVAAAPEQVSTLVRLASSELAKAFSTQYSMTPEDMLNTLLQTVFPHGPNDPIPTMAQIRMFLAVANEYRLNPFTKQIYAFPSKGGGIVPIVSVDGWIDLVNRNREFDGVEYSYTYDAASKLNSITCKMFHKERSHPTEVTEFMDECVRDTEPWKKSPKRMLRHKAYIQCARVAFGLSGIYDEDEAERIIEAEIIQHDPQKRDSNKVATKTANGTANLKDKMKEAQEKLVQRREAAKVEEEKPVTEAVAEAQIEEEVTEEMPAKKQELASPTDLFPQRTRGRFE